MPTLAINGRTLTANADATILDVARAAGIEIPTLCWYPKLPIVGNCRLCLVSADGQPKLLPACATKVAQGMVVTTESHAAAENRRGVLRLLLDRDPAQHLRNCGPTRSAERVVHAVCPSWGVGCQIGLHVGGGRIARVASPDIELDTPNQGSTCVKGRFGYDFPQHQDRLTRPLIRKSWVKDGGRWVWKGGQGAERRGGPWQTIEAEGQRSKPGTPPLDTGKSVPELPLL